MRITRIAENEPQQPLNNRQIIMMDMLALVTGKYAERTPEGYNSVGRSNGIIKELAKDEYRRELMKIAKFMDYVKSKHSEANDDSILMAHPGIIARLIGNFFMTISRSANFSISRMVKSASVLDNESYQIVLTHYNGEFMPKVIREDGTVILHGSYSNLSDALSKAINKIEEYQPGDEI